MIKWFHSRIDKNRKMELKRPEQRIRKITLQDLCEYVRAQDSDSVRACVEVLENRFGEVYLGGSIADSAGKGLSKYAAANYQDIDLIVPVPAGTIPPTAGKLATQALDDILRTSAGEMVRRASLEVVPEDEDTRYLDLSGYLARLQLEFMPSLAALEFYIPKYERWLGRKYFTPTRVDIAFPLEFIARSARENGANHIQISVER
ncbi:hypothetical protein D6817_04265 [Candidatus Pacearchaeota archaeon]|nr:MAG: hypothetical protein D6817_04265 [Candidatus Pacearchaeota archaeon]